MKFAYAGNGGYYMIQLTLRVFDGKSGALDHNSCSPAIT